MRYLFLSLTIIFSLNLKAESLIIPFATGIWANASSLGMFEFTANSIVLKKMQTVDKKECGSQLLHAIYNEKEVYLGHRVVWGDSMGICKLTWNKGNKKFEVVQKYEEDISTKAPLIKHGNYLLYLKKEYPADGLYCTNLVTKESRRCLSYTVSYNDSIFKINDKFLAVFYAAYKKIKIFEILRPAKGHLSFKDVSEQEGDFKRVWSLSNGDLLSNSDGKTHLLSWDKKTHKLKIVDTIEGKFEPSYKREGSIAAIVGDNIVVARINSMGKFKIRATYSLPGIDPSLRKYGLFMYDKNKLMISASRVGSNGYPNESYLIFYSIKDGLRELGRTNNLTGEYGSYFIPIIF